MYFIKTILFFSVFTVYFSLYGFDLDHIRHCQNLQIESQVYELKSLVKKNQKILSPQDYECFIFHLDNIILVILPDEYY